MLERRPFHVVLSRQMVLWIIDFFKVAGSRAEDTKGLRRKVNALWLRMVDEGLEEGEIWLTETEAWMLDECLHPNQSVWAIDLLTQLARVLWEHQHGIGMSETAQDATYRSVLPDEKVSAGGEEEEGVAT